MLFDKPIRIDGKQRTRAYHSLITYFLLTNPQALCTVFTLQQRIHRFTQKPKFSSICFNNFNVIYIYIVSCINVSRSFSRFLFFYDENSFLNFLLLFYAITTYFRKKICFIVFLSNSFLKLIYIFVFFFFFEAIIFIFFAKC